MIRIYYDHKPQTNQNHCEEEPQSYNILNVFFWIQLEQVFYHHHMQVFLHTFVYLVVLYRERLNTVE